MYGILVVLVGVCALASIVTVVSSRVPVEAVVQEKFSMNANKGMHHAEKVVVRYLLAQAAPDGTITYPAAGVDMAPLLSPRYGFLPNKVQGIYDWNVVSGVRNGVPAVGVCLRPKGTLLKGQLKALMRVQSWQPAGTTFLGLDCNATVNEPGGTHLTRWIRVETLPVETVTGGSTLQGGAPPSPGGTPITYTFDFKPLLPTYGLPPYVDGVVEFKGKGVPRGLTVTTSGLLYGDISLNKYNKHKFDVKVAYPNPPKKDIKYLFGCKIVNKTLGCALK